MSCVSSGGAQAEQRLEVVGTPACLEVLDVNAGLAGLLLLDEVERDATQDDEVLYLRALPSARFRPS